MIWVSPSAQITRAGARACKGLVMEFPLSRVQVGVWWWSTDHSGSRSPTLGPPSKTMGRSGPIMTSISLEYSNNGPNGGDSGGSVAGLAGRPIGTAFIGQIAD